MPLTPKNWNDFQHYKDRAPVWIKLHRALLDNYEYHCLPVASRALAPMLWLLASEYENGRITASFAAVAFRLRMAEGELRDALKPLIDGGFFVADSAPLAARKRSAIPEKEKENKRETETEKKETRARRAPLAEVTPEFTRFFEAYPHKVGKLRAVKEFATVRRKGIALETIMDGLARYVASKPADRPWLNPATFLHQGRWEDQPAAVAERVSSAADQRKSAFADALQRAREYGEGGGEPPRMREVGVDDPPRLQAERSRE
jgi:hypothetical protein